MQKNIDEKDPILTKIYEGEERLRIQNAMAKFEEGIARADEGNAPRSEKTFEEDRLSRVC